jgi:serine/threonine protein kinase/TolA-binding protein
MEKLGQYKIVGEIGRGNMGVVYKAIHPLMKRVVAVKAMSSRLISDPASRMRFYREAEAVAQLSHRNIITLYDMGDQGGEVYLVMEFLDGQDLKTIIRDIDEAKRKPLSLEARLDIFLQICSGLEHAHSKGVIHRDIKPGNIFVNRSGDVKILDFGLARLAESDLTGTNETMGTPSYMSPEQLQSAKVDARSDIYSAGTVFYELLALKKAFDADSLPGIFFKIINVDPQPIEKINPLIPQKLSLIVQKAIAKDPDRRYQDMGEMRAEFNDFLPLLEERKRAIQAEAKESLEQLDALTRDSAHLLREGAEEFERIKAEASTLSLKTGAGGLDDEILQDFRKLDYFEIAEICSRAQREYAHLSTKLEKRKLAVPLLEEAAELEKNGELAAAAQIVEGVLKDDPSFADAVSIHQRITALLEEQKAEERREKQAAAVFEEAEARFAAGDFPLCLASLAEVLKLKPGYGPAIALREEAEQKLTLQLEFEEKQQRASDALAKARTALEAKEFPGARAAAAEASSILPDSPEPAALLGKIAQSEEEYLLLREREEKIARLLTEARSLEEDGNENGALEKLNEILELDSCRLIADRMRKRIEEERNARETADKLFREAELKFLSEDPAACVPVLAEILKLRPEHKGAVDLLERAKHKIETREKIEEEERERAEGKKQKELAFKRLAAKQYRESLESFTAARALLGNDPEILSGIIEAENGIKAEERTARIRSQLIQSRRAFGEGDFKQAAECAGEALLLDPDSEEAKEILAKVEEAQEIKRLRLDIAALLANSHQALARENFEQAAKLANEVLLLDPKNGEAKDIIGKAVQAQQEKHRRETCASLLVRADMALKRGKTEEAATLLRELQPLDPANEEAKALWFQIERAQAKQSQRERVSSRLMRAYRCRRENDLMGAALNLEEILKDLDPGNKEARSLLKDIEKQRKAEEKKRRAAVSPPLAGIKTRLSKLAPVFIAGAVIVLVIIGATRALIKYYNQESCARNAQQLFKEGKYPEAAAAIRRWITEFPEDPKAQALQGDVTLAESMLRIFNTALGEKDYSKANNALLQLRRINPSDPDSDSRRDAMTQLFSSTFGPEFFQGGLSQWSAPESWKIQKGKLIVAEGMGIVRGRHYTDFEATFQVQFITKDTVSWILRHSDSGNYYRFQLTGPRGSPQNSFTGFKIKNDQETIILQPIRIGKDMSIRGEQYEIKAVAQGAKISHFINIEGESMEMGTVSDSTFADGTFGFSAKSGESFFVYGGFGIIPLSN